MGNSLVNTRDQKFVLYEQNGIERLFESDRYKEFSREVVDMILSEAEKFAVEEILPTYEIGDKRDTAVFKDGKTYAPRCYHEPYRKYCQSGWICSVASPVMGGQGLPISIGIACSELFGAANFAFLLYPALTLGAAVMIETYGNEEQIKKYAIKMFSGEWSGTMCLTEPGAGTDVGNLRTSARRMPDGTFSITGTKCFITSGDHDLTEQIVHPVLARIDGDPPGTKGISIFIVPKYRVNNDGGLGEFNDVTTGNIEHKMGIKGSATATLIFGENGNCIGELLGHEREGINVMFQLMNKARLSTGMQGLDLASVSYEHALQYAKERIQSRRIEDWNNPAAPPVAIINHPDVRRSLLWMKAHVEGMRAMNYFIAYCIDMERIAASEEEREKMRGFVEFLTPISKAYCSDKAVEICTLGIDIFGGYGYCSEYPMEQYLRDSKIATIYEGTNYIQSLDLVGRKLGQNKGRNLINLFREIAGTIKKNKSRDEMRPNAVHLEDALTAVSNLTKSFAEWGRSLDYIVPILNARPFLMIMGDLIIGWKLLQAADIAQERLASLYKEAGDDNTNAHSLAQHNPDVAFYQGKVASANYFAANVLPTVEARCKCIILADKTPIEMAQESFSV
ncbi:MAG: acyl-CoA dehydrogenase [Syntrophales bacterium]|jgi:alkylation response protein AidB-like acyl-CoA dehydrogenase